MEQDPSSSEFVVNNPEDLVQFYKNIWGWDVLVHDSEDDSWWIVAKRTTPDFPQQRIRVIERKIEISTSLLFNFEVDSISELTEKVKANGGRLYLEKGEGGPEAGDPDSGLIILPGIGKQAYYCDPEGNMFGAVEFISRY